MLVDTTGYYYTLREGGAWLRWPTGIKLPTTSNLLTTTAIYGPAFMGNVHSVAFLRRNWRVVWRWDKINGLNSLEMHALYRQRD